MPTEINIRFKPNSHWMRLGSADAFGIKFSNQYGQYIDAGYSTHYQLFFIDCRHSLSPEAFVDIQTQPFEIKEASKLDMQIKLDSASIRLFSPDGSVELSSVYYFSDVLNTMELYAENGKVFVEKITVASTK